MVSIYFYICTYILTQIQTRWCRKSLRIYPTKNDTHPSPPPNLESSVAVIVSKSTNSHHSQNQIRHSQLMPTYMRHTIIMPNVYPAISSLN